MKLVELHFDNLVGWSPETAQRAWQTFLASCIQMAGGSPLMRPGVRPSPMLLEAAQAALKAGGACHAEQYFRTHFRPWAVQPDGERSQGFFTGYYEPIVDGSLVQTARFGAPVLARPADLRDVRVSPLSGPDGRYEGARVGSDGAMEPYPSRRAIESGQIDRATQPAVWLEDHVEVFFIQVQGSARVRFADGSIRRLIYAGRNGRPYSSIGKMLIERGEIPAEVMSLERCKAWLRRNGLEPGQPGRDVLQSNESYVFFRLDEADLEPGPIGGQGIALTAGCSIAVDRNVWPYGTPVFVSGDFSSAGVTPAPFAALMVAQDTGSAIVGPARADLFIGSGPDAGEVAGKIRHRGAFVALLPRRS